MNPTIILGFVNLFFAGILAGVEFVIHYGLREPAEVLDERSQIQLRQALVLRLCVLVPAFFAPAAVTGIAVMVLAGGASGRLVSRRGNACHAHVDRDPGHWHRPD